MRTIRFDDLPDDMQVLIEDLVCQTAVASGTVGNDREIPDELPVIAVDIADLPDVPVADPEADGDDRGIPYAREMDPGEVPPILVADGLFLDGRHRVWRFRDLGLATIQAIDLTGIADPTMAAANSMGPVGGTSPSP